MAKRRKRTNRYKSKWEETVAAQIQALKIPLLYETDVVEYIVPESKHKYHPDFKVAENIYIESKGKWVAEDRKKHLLIQEQHPEVKIYIVFMNANQKIRKGSKTTYGEWASKHNIEWAHKKIKKEWITKTT